jgi:hypothetical protein
MRPGRWHRACRRRKKIGYIRAGNLGTPSLWCARVLAPEAWQETYSSRVAQSRVACLRGRSSTTCTKLAWFDLGRNLAVGLLAVRRTIPLLELAKDFRLQAGSHCRAHKLKVEQVATCSTRHHVSTAEKNRLWLLNGRRGIAITNASASDAATGPAKIAFFHASVIAALKVASLGCGRRGCS